MHKISQSAVEFISLASFMILVILTLLAIISSSVIDAKDEGNRKTAADIAEFIYKEIDTARPLSDGYIRTFSIPQTVNGINYTVNITDNRELIVNYLENEHVKFLPANISGNISKGMNEIKKANGIIYLRSVS